MVPAQRNTFFVTLDGKQINLQTADKAEAFRRWHESMFKRPEAVPSKQLGVAVLLAEFADWSEKHNRTETYQWRRRLQVLRLVEARYVDLVNGM